MGDLRIKKHPILDFRARKKVPIKFNGKTLMALEGETIAAALHAHGVKVLRESVNLHRPRGFFCATGKCSSCFMNVDGVPNVRVCTEVVKPGMVVKTQKGKGELI